jgi:hypothetical protein
LRRAAISATSRLMTIAARALAYITLPAANWSRFKFLLGHVSVQTTEPYLGCKATIPSSLVLIRKSYSVGPFPGRFASANGLAIAERISIGRGNTIVVFFSVPISTSVCKYRSWIAMG